ncbi:MAG: glycoside hydrolase domain-containing protein [Kiritimatiellia bacterium]
MNDRVNVLDWGDPNEQLRPVEIVAARNGVFSGQVVLGATAALWGLRATVEDLQAVGGGGVLDAGNVKVRWARPDGRAYQVPVWFDGLDENPPEEVPLNHNAKGAVQPVWITVKVPPTTKLGTYEGRVILEAQPGGSVPVVMRVRVADFLLPDPRNFRTYVGLYQSPTTLALHYGVPEWSPEHWQLMDKSFQLLEQVGNKIVNIPLVDCTQLGNDEGMITWVKNPDGSFDHDFSVFDRYLDLVVRRVGRQDFGLASMAFGRLGNAPRRSAKHGYCGRTRHRPAGTHAGARIRNRGKQAVLETRPGQDQGTTGVCGDGRGNVPGDSERWHGASRGIPRIRGNRAGRGLDSRLSHCIPSV